MHSKDEGRTDGKKLYIGNYEILKTLGEGSFAKVKLAVHRLTNQKVAIKCIDKDHLPDEYSIRTMHREGQLLKLLDHPNIIHLYEVMETKKEIYLVEEFAAGGEVLDYIVAHGRLKETEARKFMWQIVSALEFCHERNVVHRDLKAENLLLDEDMNIKITDFGLSNVYDQSKYLSTFCGSPVYSAPELIEGKKYIGPEVDCWSLGINLYAMVVGELPFAEKNINALYDAILSCRYEMPLFLSADCQDLIKKLIVLNPKKRFTLKDVKNHAWFSVLSPSTTRLPPLSHDLTPSLKPTTEEELDQEILQQLLEMGFEKDVILKSVIEGKYNQVSAIYFLMGHKKVKDSWKKQKEDKDEPSAPPPTAQERKGRPRSNTGNKERPATSDLIAGKDTSNAPTSNESPKSPIITKPQANPKAEVSVPSPLVPKTTGTQGVVVTRNTNATAETRARRRTISEVNPEDLAKAMASMALQEKNPKHVIHTVPENSVPEEKPDKEKTTAVPPSTNINSVLRPRRVTEGNKQRPVSFHEGVPIVPVASNVNPITALLSKAVANSNSSKVNSKESMGSSSGSKPIAKNSSHSFDSHEIRTVRFAFNLSTTSSLPPEILLQKFTSCLAKEKIDYTIDGYICHCNWLKEDGKEVNFEVEICKIPRLALHGVRFKRTRGDIWEYKKVCTKILKLWESGLKDNAKN